MKDLTRYAIQGYADVSVVLTLLDFYDLSTDESDRSEILSRIQTLLGGFREMLSEEIWVDA